MNTDTPAATRHGIAFPTLASALGGAQRVEYSAVYAWITLPDGSTVRMVRSALPPLDKWTAFNLADAAQKVLP